MNCKFFRDGECLVASGLAGLPVIIDTAACAPCKSQDNPMAANKITVDLATHCLRKSGQPAKANEIYNEFHGINQSVDTPDAGNDSGIGRALSAELEWFNPQKQKGCLCGDFIGFMNRWSIEECRTPAKRRTMVRWLKKVAAASQVEVSTADLPAAIDRAIEATAQRRHSLPVIDAPAADPLVDQWPFVWTYWAGGAVGEELRYSIRSVLQWHPTARVIVIGDRPDWYRGEFIHCPRIKRTSFHAFKDCYTKLLTAARELDQFIWMMDDIYWIKPFPIEMAATPKYVRHVSQQRYYAWLKKKKNAWAKTRARAYEFLLTENRPTYDFAAHLPQPIVSRLFLENERYAGLLDDYRNFECIYFNRYHSAAAQDFGRRYLRIARAVPRIDTPHSILNHTHSQFRGTVESFLAETFPEPSRVE